jgi:hypothetical protein
VTGGDEAPSTCTVGTRGKPSGGTLGAASSCALRAAALCCCVSSSLITQVTLVAFFEQQLQREDFLPMLRRQFGGRFRADLTAVEVRGKGGRPARYRYPLVMLKRGDAHKTRATLHRIFSAFLPFPLITWRADVRAAAPLRGDQLCARVGKQAKEA